MSEVEIRWANYQDCLDVSVVHSESYCSAYKGIIPDEYLANFSVVKREKYYQESLSRGIEKTALIFIESKAIGCIVIGKCQDVDLHETHEIQSIYLLKEYWGKGFGKRLVNWTLDEIRKLGFVNVALWVLKENTSARKFYEQLGFIVDGTERVITRGKELTQVRYRKNIGKELFHNMISLKRTSFKDPEFTQLVKLLDEDLWRRYPKTQQNFNQHNLIKTDAKVVIVYDERKPVACGCLRNAETDKSAEIKRMFVVTEMRGRGIAAVVMAELEKWAVEMGMTKVMLETGINQPEAIALYTKLGYSQIDNYGPYINSKESLCMGKTIR